MAKKTKKVEESVEGEEITKKLNSEYNISIQGGSILMILRLLVEECAKIEFLMTLSKTADIDIPDIAEEKLNAFNAIGSNLMQDARKIFGEEYLEKLFHTNEKGVRVDGVKEADDGPIPKGATIN
jgi:hypothetical protein